MHQGYHDLSKPQVSDPLVVADIFEHVFLWGWLYYQGRGESWRFNSATHYVNGKLLSVFSGYPLEHTPGSGLISRLLPPATH